MNDNLENLKSQFDADQPLVINPEMLEEFRLRYFGKKGAFREAFSYAKSLPNEEKVAFTKELNALKSVLEKDFEDLRSRIASEKIKTQIEEEWIDITLPPTICQRGAQHPLSIIEDKCIDVLALLGFKIVTGPEIETAFHNFDALNIPKHHPARDMQDTFWLDNDYLLRSHTSTVQIRTLENVKDYPIKIVSPGKVYRNEKVDATHLACFHQFEGMWIEKGITFPHLKATLKFIIKNIFGDGWDWRIKPKYYPYTEPSIGVDIRPRHSEGGWITVVGAGMVHPNVLEATGHDPKEVQGFAFGLGVSRMVTMAYQTNNIKSLYDVDLRVHKAASNVTVK